MERMRKTTIMVAVMERTSLELRHPQTHKRQLNLHMKPPSGSIPCSKVAANLSGTDNATTKGYKSEARGARRTLNIDHHTNTHASTS